MNKPLDTEETLTAELADIIRRAIALGYASGSHEATTRILAAAGMAKSAAVPSAPTFLAAATNNEHRVRARTRKRAHPYGHVSKVTKKALARNPGGLGFSDFVLFIQEDMEEPDIGKPAIRNSLKYLIGEEKAIYSDGRYSPASSEAVDDD